MLAAQPVLQLLLFPPASKLASTSKSSLFALQAWKMLFRCFLRSFFTCTFHSTYVQEVALHYAAWQDTHT